MLKKLAGYAGFMFGANAITGLFTFAVSTFGMVTRPKEAVGDYRMYMTIYEVGQGLFIFGANAAIQRYAAADAQNRMRYTAFAFWLFLFLFGLTAFGGVGLGLSVGWRYALALFGLPWLTLWWYARYIVRSNLDARREAPLMMVASLANSAAQFAFLTFTDYRDALIYGDFCALVVSGIAAMFFLRSAAGASIFSIMKTDVPRDFMRESARFAAPVWLSGQISQARTQLQSVWAAVTDGLAQVGALESSRTMWQFASKPLEYIGQATLPALVSAGDEQPKLYRELLRLCLVAFSCVGIAVASGIPLVFEVVDFIAALFGRTGEVFSVKYAEVPGLLRISAVAIPVVAFEVVTNPLSVAANKAQAVLYSNLVTIVVALGSLWPLSHYYGIYGIVLSGVLGQLASGLTFARVLYPAFPNEIKSGLRWTLIATVCCLLALGPVHLTAGERYGFLMAFPAIAIFVGLLYAVRVISAEDFRRLFRAVKERG